MRRAGLAGVPLVAQADGARGPHVRVALRGTATLRPLLAPRADEIVAWCSTILRETRAHYLKIQFRACYTVCSFAYCLDRPELARAAAEWLRRLYPTADGEASRWVHSLSSVLERNSRRHLQRTGYLRPGETWHMYLGMLSHQSAHHALWAR